MHFSGGDAMFYLVMASEIVRGIRTVDDIPIEIRPTVMKAVGDLINTKNNKGGKIQWKWNS